MPIRPRPPGDWGALYAEVPKSIIKRLEQSALRNRRSKAAELAYQLDQTLPPLEEELPPPTAKRKKKEPGP